MPHRLGFRTQRFPVVLRVSGVIAGGGVVPPPFSPAFKFNDARNSMYLGWVF